MIRFAAVLVLAANAASGEVLTSPRPMARPEAQSLQPQVALAMTTPNLRPRPRPRAAAVPVVMPLEQGLAGLVAGEAVALSPLVYGFASLRPRERPEDLVAVKFDAGPLAPEPLEQTEQAQVTPTKKGSVCGNPAIRGEKIAAIKGKLKGCGLEKPVRVTEIAGVQFSTAAILSCETALAMAEWLETQAKPAFKRRKLTRVDIAASYVCRPMNNKKGGKISEHGRGMAIDISAFGFSDGTVLRVAGEYDAAMRKAHRGACGIFGTTLGPGSDGYHEDHLHFDMAKHRSGPYCR